MKLTTGRIHDLLIGLYAIENTVDTKLAGEVRLKIAININAIKPVATIYESSRTKAYHRIVKGTQERTEVDAAMIDADQELRAVEYDINVCTLVKDDLRLDDNPKITGAIVAQVMPIITDLTPPKERAAAPKERRAAEVT